MRTAIEVGGRGTGRDGTEERWKPISRHHGGSLKAAHPAEILTPRGSSLLRIPSQRCRSQDMPRLAPLTCLMGKWCWNPCSIASGVTFCLHFVRILLWESLGRVERYGQLCHYSAFDFAHWDAIW